MGSTLETVKTFDNIHVSNDPETIAKWTQDAKHRGHYIPDRFAIRCFNHEFRIYRMAIFFGIGWAMIHEYPDKDAQISVFVSLKHRRHGFGRKLLTAVLTNYEGPAACADYTIAWDFFTTCYKGLNGPSASYNH